MKIWYIHNYTMLPEHGALNRGYYLGKYLKKIGQEPVVFVGSHPHNTNLQLIEGKEKYKVYQEKPFPWVLIKTRNYEGSKKSRVLSMIEFYRNMKYAAKYFKKPDAIIGSSAHPLAALIAIKLGKKYGCKSIMEVRDFWPESIVAYGIASERNLFIKLLYKFEKYLYLHADEIILTMENGYLYFEEKGLDKIIPKSKVHYVNNGIDIEEYRKNLQENPYQDEDLCRTDTFKVVYTGSIRKANHLGLLLDAAKFVKNKAVRFLIWGDGDEIFALKNKVRDEQIDNVIFKGFAPKKCIPSITSQADLNIMHGVQSSVMKYGLSANKLFDYAAAGKPIITDFACGRNPADEYKTGITLKNPTAQEIAEAVDKISMMDAERYIKYCENALQMANDYSYENLATRVVNIVKGEDR